MNHRVTLKKLAASSVGLVALPLWAESWSVNGVAKLPSSFSTRSKGVLASVTDTIIPPGTSFGASSLGVDKFLQKLLANCYEQDVLENVEKQLLALDGSAKRTYGNTFKRCSQPQRQALLAELDASENRNEKDFFTLIKSETIRGFVTSREVMSLYLNYKIQPVHYYHSVEV
jgi:hypothetical protein